MGSVPLGRRNLFQDRRRAALAVGGVAIALLLVLVLDGIFAGSIRQVTAYLRNLPADLIISQEGVRTMHMSSSALPVDVVEQARRVRGVESADAIRFTTSTVRSPEGHQLSYVIGYDTETGAGGPWSRAGGRAPRSQEVTLDEVAADELGVGIGDRIEVLGRTFRLAGLSSGGTSITNTITYLTTEDFAALRGPSVSYVLVRAQPGVDIDRLEHRLARTLPGVTIQTRDGFVDEEAQIVRDMSADIMQIMSFIAFLIALAIIALTLFTTTLAKMREYAVVKALGARSGLLARAVVSQATLATALAVILALALSLLIALLAGNVSDTIELAIEPVAVLRVAGAAFVAAILGALLPLRRVIRLDPASAFRG